MNILKKIIYFFKNILIKKHEIKELPEPKIDIQKDRNTFIESIKVTNIEKKKNKKIETLICDGDGLGIKKKISC